MYNHNALDDNVRYLRLRLLLPARLCWTSMPSPLPGPATLVLLHDVARHIRVLADQMARRHHLTRAQWILLMRLEERPGRCQADLAEMLEVEPITVARLVDRLAAQGWVERRDSPQDRRRWMLYLTPHAAPVLLEIHSMMAELTDLVLGDMSPDQQQGLVTGLLGIKTNLDRRNASAAQDSR